jgi:hypothetical protein
MAALMKERMCKFIFSALLVLLSFTGKGQTVDGKLYTIFNNWYQWSGGKFNTNLNIPKVTATTGRDTGGIRYNLTDSSMYIWTGSQWRKVGDGGTTPTLQQVTTAGNSTTDTIKIKDYLNNNLINLGVYQNSGNPNSRAGFLDIRNNQNTNRAQYNFQDIEFRSDNKYLRLQASISDNLNNVVTLDLPDTSGTLSAGVKVNGTIYMAGTNGISDLGTISSDTTSLSSRINERVKYTDTPAMLTPYLRKIDTTNAFLISVSQPNDSTLRFAKGATQTDYIIRSAVAGSATRLTTTVYNNSGTTISKGAVVYINGRHSSNLPTIALAQANNEANSYTTFALVETNIANGSSGIVIQVGNIGNLNLPTSSYTDGEVLYLSPTVPGGYTTTKPLAPNHITKLGTVTRAHPTQGSIQIKIENGWQLDELSDVQIAAVPNDSTILQFSRVDSLWKAVDPTTAMGNRFVKVVDKTIFAYTAQTTTYNALASDYVIHCTSGTFTVNLPTAVGVQGKVYIVKNSGSGLITIDPNGTQTIDGALTYKIGGNESLKLMSTGTNWITL